MSVSIKERYRVARAIIRANGRYAMRWVAPDLREAMNHCIDEVQRIDRLATRQRMVARRFPSPENRREVFLLTTTPENILMARSIMMRAQAY